MARSTFGGTAGDFLSTVGPGGQVRVVPGTLTFWSAETGGTQYTDLLLDGAPVSTISVGRDGQVPTFQGPDGIGTMWADGGGADRVRLLSDKTGEALASDAFIATQINTPASDTATALDGKVAEVDIRHPSVVKPEAHGAVGDGVANDTAALTAAADACAALVAAGGSATMWLEGVYRVTSQILITSSRVTVAGTGTIVQDGTMPSVLRFQGSIAAYASPTTTLTANATMGATSATVASTTGLAVDDIVVLGDNYEHPNGVPTAYSGELLRVKEITSGTVVSFYGKLRADYTTARSASVHKVTPLRDVAVRDITVRNANPNTSTAKLVDFYCCRGVTVDRVKVRGGDGPGVQLYYVYNAQVDVDAEDLTDNAGSARYGYGVNAGPCEGVTVTGRARRVRHAFTTSAGAGHRGWARNIQVAMTCEESTGSSFDTHSESSDVDFVNCRGSQTAGTVFNIRSDRTSVQSPSGSFANIGIAITGPVDGFSAQGGRFDQCGSGVRFLPGELGGGEASNISIDGTEFNDMPNAPIEIGRAVTKVLVKDVTGRRIGTLGSSSTPVVAVTAASGATGVRILGTKATEANAAVNISSGNTEVVVAGSRAWGLTGSTPTAVKDSSSSITWDNQTTDASGFIGPDMMPFYVAASAFEGTFGSPALGTVGRVRAFLLDSAASERITVGIYIPKGWTSQVIDLHLVNVGAGVGDYVISIFKKVRGSGTDLSTFYETTVGTATITAGAQNIEQVQTFSGLSMSPGLTELTVMRDGAAAGDTLGNDIGLIGMTVRPR